MKLRLKIINQIKLKGVFGDVARNHIIPTAVKYQNILINNVRGLKDIYGNDFKKYASEQLILIRYKPILSPLIWSVNERKQMLLKNP